MAQSPATRPTPRTIATTLIIPVPIFVALNLVHGFLLLTSADVASAGFFKLFDLDAEQNIPAWYSTTLLALAALATLVIAHAKRTNHEPFIKHWYALAAIFLYLSVDEALALHERSMMPMRDAFQLHGLLYYGWVIPALLTVAVLGSAYLRFLRAMPRRLQVNLIIAGATYVGGALFLEMIGGWLYDGFGPGVLTGLTAIAEETAEMVGVIWYIYALADHRQNPQNRGRPHSRAA